MKFTALKNIFGQGNLKCRTMQDNSAKIKKKLGQGRTMQDKIKSNDNAGHLATMNIMDKHLD